MTLYNEGMAKAYLAKREIGSPESRKASTEALRKQDSAAESQARRALQENEARFRDNPEGYAVAVWGYDPE